MKKRVQLPVVEPYFSAYQYQGSGGAVIAENPSINNWYINQCILMRCNAFFLVKSDENPHVTVEWSKLLDIPVFEKHEVPVRFLKGTVHTVIRAMLDEGYFAYVDGVDDYYIKGKSLYHQGHISHDGLICGYDQNTKTYSIFSYDSNWVYRIFDTPQRSLERGLLYPGLRQGEYASIYAIKPQKEIIRVDPIGICDKLKEYVNNTLDKYRLDEPKTVKGIAVFDVVCMYLDKLYSGQIPYATRDHRIFRAIRDHKAVMCKRIHCLEEIFGWGSQLSKEYEKVVRMAEQLRMIYAYYMKKQRDDILIDMKKRIREMKVEEEMLLRKLITKLEGALEYDVVEQTSRMDA